MTLRAGFAAASLLGVVTTFGTTLWVVAVFILAALVFGLAATEGLPGLRRVAAGGQALVSRVIALEAVLACGPAGAARLTQ